MENLHSSIHKENNFIWLLRLHVMLQQLADSCPLGSTVAVFTWETCPDLLGGRRAGWGSPRWFFFSGLFSECVPPVTSCLYALKPLMSPPSSANSSFLLPSTNLKFQLNLILTQGTLLPALKMTLWSNISCSQQQRPLVNEMELSHVDVMNSDAISIGVKWVCLLICFKWQN